MKHLSEDGCIGSEVKLLLLLFAGIYVDAQQRRKGEMAMNHRKETVWQQNFPYIFVFLRASQDCVG